MSPDDPARMSAEERMEEVAAILAAGFLRLKRRTPCLPPSPDPATGESAGSSKIPVESTCHLSETSPLCPSR